MRAVSLKSLCLLAGFLMPCLGATSQAEAGVIPWLYNSIFGYGWGHNYGGGYGGGVPYSVGYGSMGYGYGGGGYGYGAYMPSYAPSYGSYGYGSAVGACGCSSGLSSMPVMSTPTFATPTPVQPNPAPGTDSSPPTDGNYNSHYQPAVGSYDYYTGYSPSYLVDNGSCCVPCLNCEGGDCSTSVRKAPETNPTPVEPNPVRSKQKGLPPDQFGPSSEGTGSGVGTGGADTENSNEALPKDQIKPATRPGSGLEGVGTEENLEAPKTDDNGAPGKLNHRSAPTDRSIAVRYAPSLKRSSVAIPSSIARVVRIDRSIRVQTVPADAKSQLAAKP